MERYAGKHQKNQATRPVTLRHRSTMSGALNPLTWDQARRMRGARPAGPSPRPLAEPVTRPAGGQQRRRDHGRRAGNRPGPHPRPAHRHRPRRRRHDHYRPASDDIRIVRRTSTQPVRSIKAQQPARLPMFPRPSVKHVLRQIRQESYGTRRQAPSVPVRRCVSSSGRCGR
jgi:hypothetical protein